MTLLQDAVGEVLETVVEFGGQRVHAGLNHAIDEGLQLFLCEGHVEPLSHLPHSRRPMPKARQSRTCEQQYIVIYTEVECTAAVHCKAETRHKYVSLWSNVWNYTIPVSTPDGTIVERPCTLIQIRSFLLNWL